MSFVIGKIQSVERKVQFELPRQEGKPVKKADFIVELKVHDHDTVKSRRDRAQQYLRQVSAEMDKARKDAQYVMDIPQTDLDDEYLHEDVLNIKGIKDAEGNDIEFSSEVLDQVLQDRAARQALLDVWVELNSDNQVKRKN